MQGWLDDLTGNVQERAMELLQTPKGTKPPGELYAEAAPRIDRMLKQYDKAAPGLDVLIEHWYFSVGAAIAAGVAATIIGNAAWQAMQRKR